MKYVVQKLENKKWVVLNVFTADSDEDAEEFVNEEYDEDDGRMILSKVIVEWN